MVTQPATQQNASSARTSPVKPRRKGRRAKKITIVLLVLVALLVGADFGAAAIAEHTVSQKAREQLGLVDDPSVTIHGFPFSTQALGGNYGHISISATGVKVADKLQDADITAELHDVSAPLSDLLSGKTSAVKIGNLEGQIRIKATDIAHIEPLNKIQDLRIEPADEEFVRTGKMPDAATTTATATAQNKESLVAGIQLSGMLPIAGQNVKIDCFALIQ